MAADATIPDVIKANADDPLVAEIGVQTPTERQPIESIEPNTGSTLTIESTRIISVLPRGATILWITCFCGLARLLPDNLQIGYRVRLDPCPRCGSTFEGVYTGLSVETDYA